MLAVLLTLTGLALAVQWTCAVLLRGQVLNSPADTGPTGGELAARQIGPNQVMAAVGQVGEADRFDGTRVHLSSAVCFTRNASSRSIAAHETEHARTADSFLARARRRAFPNIRWPALAAFLLAAGTSAAPALAGPAILCAAVAVALLTIVLLDELACSVRAVSMLPAADRSDAAKTLFIAFVSYGAVFLAPWLLLFIGHGNTALLMSPGVRALAAVRRRSRSPAVLPSSLQLMPMLQPTQTQNVSTATSSSDNNSSGKPLNLANETFSSTQRGIASDYLKASSGATLPTRGLSWIIAALVVAAICWLATREGSAASVLQGIDKLLAEVGRGR